MLNIEVIKFFELLNKLNRRKNNSSSLPKIVELLFSKVSQSFSNARDYLKLLQLFAKTQTLLFCPISL